MDFEVMKEFGVLAAVAVAMFLQNKAYQDSMRKQLDNNSEQAVKREERMAARLDVVENSLFSKFEALASQQQTLVREVTSVIEKNSAVITSALEQLQERG